MKYWEKLEKANAEHLFDKPAENGFAGRQCKWEKLYLPGLRDKR